MTADVVLSERPAQAEDRAVPGHWQGDLIIGTGRSAIGTLVERSSRSTLLVHLPRLEGWGEKPYVKNGPSLGGYGAVAMTAALTASMATLPEQLRKTLTWDRGKELSGHALFTVETGTRMFFADPHSPWQRPTNENTNGLLRQYFPKGTDLSRWSAEDLEAVALALNNRPRKILGWKTPAEVFTEATTLAARTRCCIDRLNLPNTCRWRPPNASPPPVPCPLSGRLATRSTASILLLLSRRSDPSYDRPRGCLGVGVSIVVAATLRPLAGRAVT